MPACTQHIAGDRQLIARRASIFGSVVQDEVLEIGKLAVDPQRGAGISKMDTLEEVRAHRRPRNPLVQVRRSMPASK